MKQIDIESWNRKEHFEFFSSMASPYFGFTTEVDCTRAYEKAKELNVSFFVYYLHCSMRAIHLVDELRLRIKDQKVVLYDTIHVGATIAREDHTFGFGYLHYNPDLMAFYEAWKQEVLRIKNTPGLCLNGEDKMLDLIRHTTLPWLSFSEVLHPSNLNRQDSVPRITFGKFNVKDGRKMMPLSVEAHHGLADGYHLAKYVWEFQNFLND